MKLVEAISKRVGSLLSERSLTAYQLYKNGGVPRSTLSDVLLMKKKKVSTDTVYQICATLDISLTEFFNDLYLTKLPIKKITRRGDFFLTFFSVFVILINKVANLIFLD